MSDEFDPQKTLDALSRLEGKTFDLGIIAVSVSQASFKIETLQDKVARLEALVDVHQERALTGGVQTVCGMPIRRVIKLVLEAQRKTREETQ